MTDVTDLESPTTPADEPTSEVLPADDLVAEPETRLRPVSTTAAAPTGANWGPRVIPALELLVALACAVFVFVQLQPDLLLSDTTPSGGDMGAHVWGPAYLRDNLLGQGRVTGWTPDWYAGFPAYHFYMVIPSLAIIALNAGLPWYLGLPLAAAVVGLGVRLVRRRPTWRTPVILAVIAVSVVLVGMPYGIAFKLVSVSGLVCFPVAAWALGKLAGTREPVPAFLALGATVFLFDTNFTIYGGNIMSTLAGEFAFSIGLCISLLAMGLAIRGMDRHADGLHSSRAVAAIVISLVALSHLIPLFFALLGLALAMLIDDRAPRTWLLAIGATFGLAPLALADGVSAPMFVATVGAAVVVAAAIIVVDERVRRRFLWLAVTGPVAALLACFWLAPFYLQSAYFNDMGWERKDLVGPLLLTTPMKFALPVAAVGAVLSLASRDRIGVMFTIMAVVFAMAVANLGEGKLWNARLLPFYYLSVYLAAAVAIGLVVRLSAVAISERLDDPHRPSMAAAMAFGMAATLIGISLPLRTLPGGEVNAAGVYTWLGLRNYEGSLAPSWIRWNYSGYEEKPSYREYRDVVTTMDELGESNGCGRAMWEYDADLNRYGTPMALMLLPHWTDGCIGSMEGLYFESSASTPFHFLNQSKLSLNPSRAQRDLPYGSFDINSGIAQLKVMGVRYYMALTDGAITAARTRSDLVEVAESQPWVVFEVVDNPLVEPLTHEPVVASGPSADEMGELANRFDIGWESQAVTFYNDPASYTALPAEDGPEEWERVTVLSGDDGRLIDDPAVVSDIVTDNDTIRFSVDQIGTPVLVKTSYFPNWEADGADGPYRAGPNLMVVIPTDTEVELHYGYTGIDFLGYALTLLGLAGLAGLMWVDHHKLRSTTVAYPDHGGTT